MASLDVHSTAEDADPGSSLPLIFAEFAMAKVQLDAVRKVYPNGHVVIANATLDVRDGELMVVVGPSGCGKSTLLRMIAGLESISSGTLRIGEQVVNALTPQQRNIAMVFQNFALYPHMTVAQNLAFGLRVRGVDRGRIDEQIATVAQLLDIAHLLKKRPGALSGGQQQRVALGRAICRQPQIFLLDEPLSHLDPRLRDCVRREIARLHQHLAATMIYVTHDYVEAMTLGQRICVMHRGSIQQIASPSTLYSQPINRFVAGFIGNPAMNFLAGSLCQLQPARFNLDTGGMISLPPLNWPHAWLHRALVLGLRPEHVFLATRQDDVAYTATVIGCESLGHETHLHVGDGGMTLVVRLRVPPFPRQGETVMLGLNGCHVHIFDAQSGQRLTIEQGC